MAKTKRTAKRRRHSRRNTRLLLVSVLAIVITLACAVGGTLAWLVSASDPVVNTFTYGDINITLDEAVVPLDGSPVDPTVRTEKGNKYKMMPGEPITKDPKVTVMQGSEACWLFVKLEKSSNFDDFMEYEMVDGWVELTGADGQPVEGVFFRAVSAEEAADADKEFVVIKDNTVSVKDEVTKAQLNALTEETYPSLTITAYAVQQVGFEAEITEGDTAPTIEQKTNAAALKAWAVAQSDAADDSGTTNP